MTSGVPNGDGCDDRPLDMRLDDRLLNTAADLLATLSINELSPKLQELADEPDHERVAQAIVQRRAIQPITQTRQLARLVLAAQCSSRRAARGDTLASARERHPAARALQALRIVVNDEVGGSPG